MSNQLRRDWIEQGRLAIRTLAYSDYIGFCVLSQRLFPSDKRRADVLSDRLLMAQVNRLHPPQPSYDLGGEG